MANIERILGFHHESQATVGWESERCVSGVKPTGE